MIVALRIARIDHIVSFRRTAIALLLLSRKTASPQCDLVGFDDLAPGQQFKHMIFFQN
ncbi:MAG: hypothetical protein ABSE46_20715 [Terracidiphilus sp.]